MLIFPEHETRNALTFVTACYPIQEFWFYSMLFNSLWLQATVWDHLEYHWGWIHCLEYGCSGAHFHWSNPAI